MAFVNSEVILTRFKDAVDNWEMSAQLKVRYLSMVVLSDALLYAVAVPVLHRCLHSLALHPRVQADPVEACDGAHR